MLRDPLHAMRRNGGFIILLIAAAVWVAGILLPSLLHGLFGQDAAALLLRAAYAPVCHQDLSRSFSLLGFPLAVCGRCTAISVAGFLAVLAYPLLRVRFRLGGLPLRSLLLLLAPMALDVALDVAGILANSPFSRVCSGSLAGIGAALFAAHGAETAWSELRALKTSTIPAQDFRP